MPGRQRNTPTGVGKTRASSMARDRKKKHPHGCGEDHILATKANGQEGNTPTGVGKTTLPAANVSMTEKHPHGCGEDACTRSLNPSLRETPPRVWGRLHPCKILGHQGGNTPTGVGKTPDSYLIIYKR